MVEIDLPEGIDLTEIGGKAQDFWTKGESRMVTVSKHRKFDNTEVRVIWEVSEDKKNAKLYSASATPVSMLLDDDAGDADKLETQEFCKNVEALKLLPYCHIEAVTTWSERPAIKWKI